MIYTCIDFYQSSNKYQNSVQAPANLWSNSVEKKKLRQFVESHTGILVYVIVTHFKLLFRYIHTGKSIYD